MLSRATVLKVGAAVTVVAGMIGLVATRRPAETTVVGRGNSPSTVSIAQGFEKNADVDHSQPRSLALIHELLLDQQRIRTPAERGHEDEIRCALAGLLGDENAGIIVRRLRSDELRTEFGVSALALWAKKEPLTAALWLADQPAPSDEQTWAIARVLAQDPAGLEVLSERLPASPWRETLLEAASRALLATDPDEAVRLAYRLQAGSVRTRLLAGIADEWAMREPDAAARWMASEPDVAVRDELLCAGAVARASLDPTEALEWADNITSEANRRSALDKIAAMWTDASTESAYRVVVLAALRRQPN